MSPTTPKRSTVKTGRKKLKLNKETLKDLTSARGEIKGGGKPVNDSLAATCGCAP